MDGPIHNDFDPIVLSLFNYTVFPNGTLSNHTNCYLTFGEFQPFIFDNGTVVNGTSCDYPYYPMATRGIVGMVWAILLILLVPLSLFNLRKHGMPYTEERKTFRRFGRKWQWYWLLIAQALGAIAGFFSIDIDRDYIQGSSITIYGAIFCSVLPVSLGVGWELTRHWGSFEERKIVDLDPFRFRPDDYRAKVHLIMPIIFYLFGFLTFFMTILRNWSFLAAFNAEFSVDTRWKAGGVFSIIAFFQIIAQIVVTRYYYKVTSIPLVIPTVLFFIAVIIAYNMTFIWNKAFSPFDKTSSILFLSLMGYLPLLLIVIIMNISGLARDNEDRVILARRDERDVMQMAIIRQQNADAKAANDGASNVATIFSLGPPVYTDTDPSKKSSSGITIDEANTSHDSSTNKEANESFFYKFFGSSRGKGTSWLSHNFQYIPFINRKRDKSPFELPNKAPHERKVSVASIRKANQNTAPKPPPRDIRESWIDNKPPKTYEFDHI